MLLRPMLAADIPSVERVTAEAFYAVDVATHRADEQPPSGPRPPERAERWRRHARHLHQTDPEGCWVAEDDDGLCGAALSLRRDGLWGLSTYAVLPRAQGRGTGKALLEAALRYSEGCLRGIICASTDPRAARRYRLAGFALHPAMRISGKVARELLPVVDGVRAGSAGDADFCDSVDRQVRGSAHGVDHSMLVADNDLLICDLMTGRGYCYVEPRGVPLLAATSRRVAQRLLWSALSLSAPGDEVGFGDVTADQQWALDVALAAGLEIRNEGFVCVRHMRPPAPYLPSTRYL